MATFDHRDSVSWSYKKTEALSDSKQIHVYSIRLSNDSYIVIDEVMLIAAFNNFLNLITIWKIWECSVKSLFIESNSDSMPKNSVYFITLTKLSSSFKISCTILIWSVKQIDNIMNLLIN